MPQLVDRRTLLKAMASLAGGMAGLPALQESIAQAAAIDPPAGSTYLDAEHVVFLMQENRSFDHCFGSLQGVRGFNDPRAIDLPGGRPVWLQANAKGEVFAPFRLDMNKTCNTWLGCLPHNWGDQVDARNHGKYDRWLQVKRSGGKLLAQLPLTLGYNTRADLPFYYALADAFTICDQNFCSVLTGTTPNRLHFWTGTIRSEQKPEALPHVYNSDTDKIGKLTWATYPERLSNHGVSWKVYQNELAVETGLTQGELNYLSNFGDNPLEYFAQYQAGLSPSHLDFLKRNIAKLTTELAQREKAAAAKPDEASLANAVQMTRQLLAQVEKSLSDRTEALSRLPPRERDLQERGLTTNRAQADYRELEKVAAQTSDGKRMELNLPKGDVLHQFRQDVMSGKLPTVSWLVAPRYFSDHPDSPWFGAWYVSETLNILTQNPEVWKKTIFVLTYDENDGYFDHCPPFQAPAPGRPETGGCSEGIDSELEYINRDRESSIGLGYRVPMVVASPWSRGGWVNSQVFDHTSALKFLEHFLERTQGQTIRETNINSWRRAMTGDLTSVFRPSQADAPPLPTFVKQTEIVAQLSEARTRPLPDPGKPLTPAELEAIRKEGNRAPRMPQQEPGTRPACALPYELNAEGALAEDQKSVVVQLSALNRLFGAASAGSPFQIYAPGRVVSATPDKNGQKVWDDVRVWSYGVAAGQSLSASFSLADFDKEQYFLRVYGPNGFFRELKGSAADPSVHLLAETERNDALKATGNLRLNLHVPGNVKAHRFALRDNAYGNEPMSLLVPGGKREVAILSLEKSFGWYDFTLTIEGAEHFSRRYAGRVESGRPTRTDPQMAGQAAPA